MPLTLGDFADFTLGDLYEMDLTPGDLGTMNHDDLMKRAYSTIKRFALAHSQDLEDRFHDLETKYQELSKTSTKESKWKENLSLGLTLVGLIVQIVFVFLPDKYSDTQQKYIEEYNMMQSQLISVEETQTEVLTKLNANIEAVLTQSALLIKQQEYVCDSQKHIDYPAEKNGNNNSKTTDCNGEVATDDTSSQDPELG